MSTEYTNLYAPVDMVADSIRYAGSEYFITPERTVIVPSVLVPILLAGGFVRVNPVGQTGATGPVGPAGAPTGSTGPTGATGQGGQGVYAFAAAHG